MPWSTSDRRDRLPTDWQSTVARILARDGHRCRQKLPSGLRCPRSRASGHRVEVDHRWSPDRHDDANLWTLCAHHHKQKTQREAQEARSPRALPVKPDPHPAERIGR